MAIRCLSKRVFAPGLLLLSATCLFAQQPGQTTAVTTPPLFDVVSIHENKTGSNNVSIRNGDGSFVATNISLINLLMNAYHIRPELISGLPGWANSTHFDVNAKISDPDIAALKKRTSEQRRAESQAQTLALLTDRFHLQAHIETKTLPVYDLVIAKSGPRLKENTTLPSPDTPGTGPRNLKPGSMMISNSGSNSEMTAVGVPISNFAQNLAFQVERNVIDKTGLTSKYDFSLKWTPMQLEGKTDGTADNNAPDIFTALQEELGLKLEPSKGPVDTLVVDHVEMPTEN